MNCMQHGGAATVLNKAASAFLTAPCNQQPSQQLQNEQAGLALQVGMNNMDCYNADFEAALLEASAEYYKRKAAAWTQVPASLQNAPHQHKTQGYEGNLDDAAFARVQPVLLLVCCR